MVGSDQRCEAHINIELQSSSNPTNQSLRLHFHLKAANYAYATYYSAAVGPHVPNTNSTQLVNCTP